MKLPRRRRRSHLTHRKRCKRASTVSTASPASPAPFARMNSDTGLPPLYIEIPEVLDFGLADFENSEITKDCMDPLIQCSDDDILDAFREATDGINEEKKNDFSLESIFNLGPLPHSSRCISYELPSPSTLHSLPSFSMPTSKAPKPKIFEVDNIAEPKKVAISLPLKSSIIELRPWRPNSDQSGSFMDIPINQKDVFARINALMASKPKKPEIRKNRLTQTTIQSFRQQKSTQLPIPPAPKLAPVCAPTDVPVLNMPVRAQEVVFNRMLVCEA